MTGFDRGRRRIFLFLAAIGAVILLMNLSLLSGTDVQSKIKNIPVHIPLTDKKPESGKDTAPNPNVRFYSFSHPYRILTFESVAEIRLMVPRQ
jgi:hypothetical protein